MLYAAKCYWPGVGRADLEAAASRFAEAEREFQAQNLTYRGSLLFGHDDLVLFLFDGPSRRAVKRVSERMGIPCERVMDSAWLDPPPGEGDL
jgi:hypothetical protein